MIWPFISRRQHDATVAKLRARVIATEARHDERERERRNLARLLAEADATNKRLAGRNDELTRRLEAGPGQAASVEAATVEPRIEGGLPRRTPLTGQLREARAHAAALEKRLAEVTAANQRCTCGGAS